MLFIENSYLKDFETKIKKIENNNIILEQTAFYAKSGGQPGDIGKIIFLFSIFLILVSNFFRYEFSINNILLFN